MILLASTIPSNDGYVAAAYIVFFALILIYVAIMGVRLTRVERRLRELQREREDEPPVAMDAGDAAYEFPEAERDSDAEPLERETV